MVRKQSGFTLIELMVVIGVTGLVLAVAAVKFDSYIKDDAVDKAVYKMKYDITYLQNRKLADTRDYKMEIDVAGKSYTCFIDDDNDNIPDTNEVLTEPATKQPMRYEFAVSGVRQGSITVYKNIVLTSAVVYNRSGSSAESGGRIILFIDKYGAVQVWNGTQYEDISSNNESKIVLNNGTYTRTLTMYPLSTDMKIE